MATITIKNKDGKQIVLGNSAPFILTRMDGVSNVNNDISTQKTPRQDGSTYIFNSLGNRYIRLEGTTIGTSSEVLANKRLINEIVNPKLGKVTLIYNDGVRNAEIEGVAESSAVFGTDKTPTRQPFAVSFECHQPFWVEPLTESEVIALRMGGISFKLRLPTTFASRGQRRKCNNTGDTETPVLIKFYGPGDNPTITNENTGEFIKVEQSLGADDILEISTEFGNKYVRLNGVNKFNFIDLDSTFWQLQRGTNVLSYSSLDDSERTSVLVEWKNRYIGF